MNRLSVKMLIGALSFSLCAESVDAQSVKAYETAAVAAAKKRNEQLKKRRAELEIEARQRAQMEIEVRKRQEAQQRAIEQKAELAAQEQRKWDEWARQIFIKNFAENIKNCSQDFYVITEVGYHRARFDEIKISDSSVNLIDIILQSLEWEGDPHKVTSVEKLNDPTAKNYFTVKFSIGNKIESYIEYHADNLFIRTVDQYADDQGVHLYGSAWENMDKYYFQRFNNARRLTVKRTEDDSGKVIASEASGEIGRCSIPTLKIEN